MYGHFLDIFIVFNNFKIYQSKTLKWFKVSVRLALARVKKKKKKKKKKVLSLAHAEESINFFKVIYLALIFQKIIHSLVFKISSFTHV